MAIVPDQVIAKARKAGQEPMRASRQSAPPLSGRDYGATGDRRYVIVGHRSGPECPWNTGVAHAMIRPGDAAAMFSGGRPSRDLPAGLV